jgi:uncharacterized protein YjbI with pentapeptide repeats
MPNPEHLDTLQKGVDTWNQWRKDHPEVVQPDLSGADLNGANLSDTDLRGVNLFRANFRKARLQGSFFNWADLRGARLHWADLRRVDLTSANLSEADLRGVDLREATFAWTILADVDLSDVNGLELIQHKAPSSIGIDTLYRSLGKLPEVFLSGAGVPDLFISYARSLVGQPIEFYSCFISYANQDHGFAERLHADLRSKNLRCWFAPEDLKIGDRFQERIEESIRLYDKVMIVLSRASTASRWVEREVNAAREREDRENRSVLFPIRIDDAVMDATAPWAADMRRTRHIGDFTRWKDHDSYQKAFERLLRDLKAETSGAASATKNRAETRRPDSP